MSNSIFIVYLNRFNEAKAYELDVLSESEETIIVWDLRQDKYKTLKTSNILLYCICYKTSIAMAETLQKKYPIISKYKTDRRWKNEGDKFEVFFTGFKKSEKDELIELAKVNNMFLRTAVTKKLGLLVCGYNAGPAKMKMANENGVNCVFGADGFNQFIATGEVGE